MFDNSKFIEGESYKKLSKRSQHFIDFALKVVEHIEIYTVPQYGDEPVDNVESWDAETCLKQVDKYQKRRNSSRREGEKALDIIKSAHYLQLAHHKLFSENEKYRSVDKQSNNRNCHWGEIEGGKIAQNKKEDNNCANWFVDPH